MLSSVKEHIVESLIQSTAGKVLLCGGMALFLYRKRQSVRDYFKEIEPYYSKVLFFPDPQSPCYDFIFKPQGCTKDQCLGCHDKNSSFYQLILNILNAKHTIYMCMYSITCKELSDAILLKFGQGVDVRLVTDTTYMHLSGSRISEFMEAGINVRHHRQQSYMHNKFVVVDSKVAITGSANWTQAAIVGNNENVVISNREDFVEPFSKEFMRLWKKFDVEEAEF